jgi:rare lipoprotein A
LYPYTIKGVTYYPHTVAVGETKVVKASWYGEYFHGRKTALGEIYDMYGYTAAHKTYPLGTVLRITNPKNGKSLEVRVNDRGPFWNDREIDLSMGAAEFLGTKRQGVAKVKYRVVSVPSIANSFVPRKGKIPLKPTYNVGYTASSYSSIGKKTKKVPIEIGTFLKKKEASQYLKKLKKYLPKAYILDNSYNYKIKFSMVAKEEFVKKELKRLKQKGLITGYGLCWSYD